MVKVISTSKSRNYIPTWEGNDTEVGADQIIVELKAVTIAMKEKLSPRVFNFDETGKPTMSVGIDRKKTLREMIICIRNLSVEIDGELKVVSTVDQLFNTHVALDGLVEELYTHCTELLNQTGVDEKN